MSANDNFNNQQQFTNERWLDINISVKNNDPKLLQGLEQWLKLNLITEDRVINICRQYLSCKLSTVTATKKSPVYKKEKSLVFSQQFTKEEEKLNIIGQLWQAFIDELSIRWLLFLGIFLVVVSSGVLAASQWNNFSKLGQYLVLFTYTIAFWAVSSWSRKQDNLQLTSQTLNAIATLLIPINFWAINRIFLNNSLLEWCIIAVAFISLSIILFWQQKSNKNSQHKFFVPLFLLLSYLHLGWQFDLFAIIAIYSSFSIIIFLHYRYLLPQTKYPIKQLLFLLSAWLLLLVRGLFIEQLNYNLAVVLFGWFITTVFLTRIKVKFQDSAKLQQSKEATFIFSFQILQFICLLIISSSWLLLLLAGTSRSPLYFWQTTAISLLAIHLFTDVTQNNEKSILLTR